jgi:hypothetical protein
MILMKKKTRRQIAGIIIIIVFLGSILYLLSGYSYNNKPIIEEPNNLKEIEDYGYVLHKNKTELYNNLFNDLVELLSHEEVDEELYVSLIVKLFITDFYNLNNKITKNDIGGTQYIHSSIKENFILNAQQTLYKNIENNIYGDRIQELPSVTSIEILTIEKTAFTYEGKTDNEAFKIEVSWGYDKDMGYQDRANLIIVREEKKLSIVELI